MCFVTVMFPPAVKLFEKLNFTTMKRAPLNYFIELVNMLMQRKVENPHDQVCLDNNVWMGGGEGAWVAPVMSYAV